MARIHRYVLIVFLIIGYKTHAQITVSTPITITTTDNNSYDIIAGGSITVGFGGDITGTVDINGGTLNIDNGGRVSGSIDAISGDMNLNTGGQAVGGAQNNGGTITIAGGQLLGGLTANSGSTMITGSVSADLSVAGGDVSIDPGGSCACSSITVSYGSLNLNTYVSFGTLNYNGGSLAHTGITGTTLNLNSSLSTTNISFGDINVNSSGSLDVDSDISVENLTVAGSVSGSAIITSSYTTITGSGSMWDATSSSNPNPDCSAGCCQSGCATPLPVELLFFEGKKNNDNYVSLAWSTATELNNDYFEIQRSQDGFNFYQIGKIPGNGTTNTTMYYQLNDKFPLEGICYYRLLQVDYDGSSNYHPMIRVEISNSFTQNKLFPSPARLNEPFSHSNPDVQTLYFYQSNGSLYGILNRNKNGYFDLTNLPIDVDTILIAKDMLGNVFRLSVTN
jgi:hypothetical protein